MGGVIIKTILNKIKEYQTIIIHRHIRPDGDCIGSQIGLKEIIKNSFIDKDVYVVGEEKEQFFLLGRMDEIEDELYNDALVIIVDVANKGRFSDSRYKLGKELIKIDHHPKLEEICNIEWIDTSYASCCEMIVDFYHHFIDELTLSDHGAKALFYGMVTDTNRFSSLAINKRTFYLASVLMNFNFNLAEIYNSIYVEPENMIRLCSYIISNYTKTKYGVGFIKIDQKLCDQFNIDASFTNIAVNALAYIEGIHIFFVAIYDDLTKKVRISLRSRKLSISHYAKMFGGGGHKNACGIIVDSFGEVEKLSHELDNYLKLRCYYRK